MTTSTDLAVKPAIDWTSIDTPIKHEGKAIVLPGDPAEMDYDAAIATIERIKKDEATEFNVTELVRGAPWDALVCIYSAMQAIYGVVTVTGIPTWFGKMRPEMVSVRTGPGAQDVVQVPVGEMNLPNVAKPIRIQMTVHGAAIVGVVRKRERALLVELANKAREIMRERSVYRAKAIRIAVDDDGDLILHEQPRFLDLASVKESDAIHTAETEMMIQTNIFSPLKNTAACRHHRIPLKRGILLEGKYGTGKSLTARVTAKVAADNGWTFIMLDRVQGLKTAIEFARHYQPCVIFAEDIDRAADRSDESVNDLVNLLDGVTTKDVEIMTVLTTNFVEQIDKALLRPGRFDAVISIQAPDAPTVERLIRAYARDLIGEGVSLTETGKALAGHIPATVREVVERAKLSMLVEDRTALSEQDLLASAIGMKRHLELLNPADEKETKEQSLWKALSSVIADAVSADVTVEADMDGVLTEIGKLGQKVKEVDHSVGASRKMLDAVGSASVAVLNKADEIAAGVKKIEKNTAA